MKRLCLNAETLPMFKEKFGCLTPDTPRQWGKLDAAGMITHIRTVLEASMGERELPDESNAFTRLFIFRKLIYDVMPWPKGKIKVTDAATPKPEFDFETERRMMFEAVDRFVEAVEKTPERKTLHAGFGTISIREWSRIHGRHNAHHLEQFGVQTGKET